MSDRFYFQEKVMGAVFQILKLSRQFFDAYPHDQYPELMEKENRPYNCLLVEMNTYFICVPFRTEMNHNNGYHFSGSQRSVHHKSGLDYSKAVIVTNDEYISNAPGIVDKDEYNECVQNMEKITNAVTAYVLDYIEHRKGEKLLHEREFHRRYQYSTLKYFEKELGI